MWARASSATDSADAWGGVVDVDSVVLGVCDVDIIKTDACSHNALEAEFDTRQSESPGFWWQSE